MTSEGCAGTNVAAREGAAGANSMLAPRLAVSF